MNTARDNNNHGEKAIVYPFFDNESNQIKQKVIKAPEELIDNFENVPNADEIREKFERIKSCVKKFTLLLDKDDLDEAQKNRMAYLTNNLQTYFREYDILTTKSPEDKAFKQLLYGTEKYKFLGAQSAPLHVRALEQQLTRDAKTMGEGYMAKVRATIDVLHKEADAIDLEESASAIRLYNKGATITAESIYDETYDCSLALRQMQDRSIALRLFDENGAERGQPPEVVRSILLNARHDGERAEFVVRLLTNFPRFTYDYNTYKEAKKNKEIMFYLGADKHIYE